MKTFFDAYRERLERNQNDLYKLAKEVALVDPTVEIYKHKDSNRFCQSLTFFKDELINSVSFHEVPYRWSGCGFKEHGGSHYGIHNTCMPFDANDVLTTFRPITEILYRQQNEYFKSKKQYLEWFSFLRLIETSEL